MQISMKVRDAISGASGQPQQCTRCDDDATTLYLFDFERLDAAHAAHLLSQQLPHDYLIGNNMALPLAAAGSSLPMGHPSAKFMSLAYFAGGMPMIAECGKDDTSPGWLQEGWFAYRDGNQRIEGNNAWNAHNSSPPQIPSQPSASWKARSTIQHGYVSQLIANGRGIGSVARHLTQSRDGTDQVLIVPVSSVINPATGYVTSAGFLNTVLGDLAQFKAGDYVLVVAGAITHGFMIIGYGPAVDSRYLTTSQGNLRVPVSVQHSWDPTGRGLDISIDPAALVGNFYFGKVKDDTLPEPATVNDPGRFNESDFQRYTYVPYVVDWHVIEGENAYSQGARPFYGSMQAAELYDHAEPILTSHDSWIFIPAPDRVSVHCKWIHDEYFYIDPSTGQAVATGSPWPAGRKVSIPKVSIPKLW